MLSTVVLPAPLGPITLVTIPGFASKLTPFAARMPPNAMPTSRTTRSRRVAGFRKAFTLKPSAEATRGSTRRQNLASVPITPSGASQSTTRSKMPKNRSRYSASQDSISGSNTLTRAPITGPSVQPAPPIMTASRNRMDCENGKLDGATNIRRGANIAPARPVSTADIAKAAVFKTTGLRPIERAATSASRTATIPLPRLLSASR